MLVCFCREVRSAFHLNTVNGRVHILHSVGVSEIYRLGGIVHTSSMVFFQHLNIGILGQAIFAHGGKICRFPS